VDHHDQGGALHEEPAHGVRSNPSAQAKLWRPAGRKRKGFPLVFGCWLTASLYTSQVKVCRRSAAAREPARTPDQSEDKRSRSGSKERCHDARCRPRQDQSRSEGCQFLVEDLYSSFRTLAGEKMRLFGIFRLPRLGRVVRLAKWCGPTAVTPAVRMKPKHCFEQAVWTSEQSLGLGNLLTATILRNLAESLRR
jgi:hypothetical protein